jgi:hypothetical protein
VDDELRALRDSCTRFLAGHGPRSVTELLAGIPAGTVIDRYGAGGVVAELETEVAGVLGQAAAVFRTTPEAFAAAARTLDPPGPVDVGEGDDHGRSGRSPGGAPSSATPPRR